MTTPPKIYVEVPITYGEMIDVLEKLGFQKELNDNMLHFSNEKYKSKVILPERPLDAVVELVHVATYSHRLYLQGVIKHEEDLIRMIQKMRLKKVKAKSLAQ
jgi:hypothetical protein